MNKTIIETDRLILRPWEETESDAEALYKYACDEKVGPAAGWPVHKNVKESLDIIKNVLSEPETYAVVLKETGEPIGSTGIMLEGRGSAPMKENEAEIGYWIGSAHWGKGYAPEAVRALIKRCFEHFNCAGIFCGYFEGNDKSRRVQEKCGFLPYGEQKCVCRQLGGIEKKEFLTYLKKEDHIKSKQ